MVIFTPIFYIMGLWSKYLHKLLLQSRLELQSVVLGCDHIEVYGIRYTLYDSVSATDQISLIPRYITWMSSVAESKSYSVLYSILLWDQGLKLAQLLYSTAGGTWRSKSAQILCNYTQEVRPKYLSSNSIGPIAGHKRILIWIQRYVAVFC